MFDFGFSELVVCGVVGLVVLGPEKLPEVAKTAGQWIGKAQRFVQQMKEDIDRETELSELKKIKDDAQKVASDLNSTVQNAAKDIEKNVDSVAGEAQKNMTEAEKALEDTSGKVATSIDSFSDDAAGGSSDAESSSGSGAGESYDSSDFSWNDDSDSYTTQEPHVFEKRYISGPSVDELAAEVENLREKLKMSRHQFVGNNRRYAPRARSNRPRIYR
ncbi:Sec-independent protein translocase protein TatB [Mesosutterella sp. AGMB02718]|uniref:Sec-independent protein translocase protein TatB n=1 Tax=Mesosutterella faecium TaxID=2925194 RepID=A0ABT7IK04_9BURK|nr:Sec-independent protein translocase protein TatB [Mesosutterella sp. AGMB02718]MDL2058705.1 Sec-independent protein translocase protein TatB [Mesosutterella sp. AGMB02718]